VDRILDIAEKYGARMLEPRTQILNSVLNNENTAGVA
jgi:hypothetical protein